MIISTFGSVFQAYVRQAYDESWPVIAELLTTHWDVDSKEKAGLFNLYEFKSIDDPSVELGRRYRGERVDGVWVKDYNNYDPIPGTVRRCKGNVIALNGIILDIDGDRTIDEMIQELPEDLEYVLYTSFRHKSDHHKFRVVIPFSRPLAFADIVDRQPAIEQAFPRVDPASFTMGQCFYLHSGPEPFTYHNRGELLDPYSFRVEVRDDPLPDPVRQTSSTWTTEETDAYRSAVVASLRTCSGLHYAGSSSRYGVLTLVSICKSIDLSYEEYDRICSSIADPESHLTHPAVRREAWESWRGNRIKRETRDQFISCYGGEPVRVKSRTSTHTDKMANYQQTIALVEKIRDILKGTQ